LLIPTFVLSLSIYAFVKKRNGTGILLGGVAIGGFAWVHFTVRDKVECAAVKALMYFAVGTGLMKALDIFSLRNSLPTWSALTPKPGDALLSFLLLTELRYESFTPNAIRLPPLPSHPFPSSLRLRQTFYSETVQLPLHILLFTFLQFLPQHPVIKAYGILLTIYNIWTALQLVLRKKTSPPLFGGPIYLAESLTTFWTETWHNAFASPCLNLAYTPTSSVLRRLGFPKALSRSAGVVSGFALMAIFHVYALSPLLNSEGMWRIGVFFTANGVFTVLEVAIWGRKRHWARGVIAWIVESWLATWTVVAIPVADGVLGANWRALCKPG
ncbi:hypothetical protein GQ43DRAFT_335495, partial [Delitschia confertaspora ATCC 74209]